MKSARAGSNPYLSSGSMTIDDDFSTVGKLHFNDPTGLYFIIKIGVSRLQRFFYALKHFVSHLIELGLVHRVLVSNFISGFCTMRQLIFSLGLLFLLSACGTKGPLTLPPKQDKTTDPTGTKVSAADASMPAGRY